ncbi:UDP-N-acetylmuramoyl-L-alanine--D-glutamate ligase [Celerinatantimonas diazotrophica]|uniref:UDP-N-acetylmuramoylalanine--D-glutamate ligase n=1 Tax=Celerinatantimonas diazotrophica TaxID=412034 RepID=A0A4R1K1W1_9GAMM|nr:UDP-N-acetylmuramoyl-L-alanine--D-glutamate ligase [Celerinatantimonas diazotrophica]TCK57962.1 UDP-N-acetylmuramoylalanine--D-glutamate ligase [Celerinatantimonas diazotrophica]CAG9297969.1 UDP-N-acetylmuramoylalanine--D-glutamate ligase [Celerinatantimonas diazotrophica]
MEMQIAQHYGVIGLGRSGLATVQYLLRQGITPVVFDTRENPVLAEQLPAQVSLFKGQLELFESELMALDTLIVAPGLSVRSELFARLRSAGKAIMGDVELFARHCDAPVIGITGSNGKTTVTTLVGQMAKASGVKVEVGGNIGTPVLELLGHDAKLYVLELSSFQLETTDSLQLLAATVLNVSSDHMNRYRDLADYRDAKRRIYQHCQTCLVNADDLATTPEHADTQTIKQFSLNQRADYWVFKDHDEYWLMAGQVKLIACSELKMSGRHNWANALAAVALGDAAGLKRSAMIEVLRTFGGLTHRCEFITEFEGVRYINDSKATNIGATIAALQGFEHETGQTWLIAGGDGKGADFTELAPWLAKTAGVAIFGQDADQIANVYPQAHRVKDLAEAIDYLATQAQSGDRILLSPACASWDMYPGFAARGEHFRALVEGLCS